MPRTVDAFARRISRSGRLRVLFLQWQKKITVQAHPLRPTGRCYSSTVAFEVRADKECFRLQCASSEHSAGACSVPDTSSLRQRRGIRSPRRQRMRRATVRLLQT